MKLPKLEHTTYSSLAAISAVLVFSVTGTLILKYSFAATTFVSMEAEAGQRSSSMQTVSDTAASGGQAVKFTSGIVGALEKPGPTNTGPSNPALLQPRGSLTVTQEGAVIENVDITGIVRIQANNVTLRNFRINANGASYGIQLTYDFTGIVLEHGEVYNMGSAGIYGLGFTARHLNIHDGQGDGIKAQGNSGGPVLVEKSWIHRLGMGDGAHADGDQSRSGKNITFRYNNCDMPINEKGGPGDPYKSNACFMLQTAEGPMENFLIENNWLNGGNYTVYCPADGVNVRVLNNKFGDQYRYGIRNGSACAWTGNTWEATGQPAS